MIKLKILSREESVTPMKYQRWKYKTNDKLTQLIKVNYKQLNYIY